MVSLASGIPTVSWLLALSWTILLGRERDVRAKSRVARYSRVVKSILPTLLAWMRWSTDVSQVGKHSHRVRLEARTLDQLV